MKTSSCLFSLIAASLLILQGCASTRIEVQPDPMYAPVDLKAPQFQSINNGSIFQTGRSVRLFEDTKAFRIGDLLSITLSESTNASKSAATNTTKDDEIALGAGTILGVTPTYKGKEIFNNEMTTERGFTGSGDSNQSNSLQGEISVMVIDIMPNGNLMVRGEKIIGFPLEVCPICAPTQSSVITARTQADSTVGFHSVQRLELPIVMKRRETRLLDVSAAP